MRKQLDYKAPELVIQDYEQSNVFCVSDANASTELFEETESIVW